MRIRQALVVAFLATTAAAQSAPPPEPSGPALGDVVQEFDAEGLDGTPQRVSFPKGRSTVLLFFMSSCPTCHRMLPVWNAAYDRRPKGLAVLAVMLDQETPDFFMANPVTFPVLRAPGRTPRERQAFTESHKIRRVPVTLRVGPGGKVEDVGLGLLDAIRLGELFRP